MLTVKTPAQIPSFWLDIGGTMRGPTRLTCQDGSPKSRVSRETAGFRSCDVLPIETIYFPPLYLSLMRILQRCDDGTVVSSNHQKSSKMGKLKKQRSFWPNNASDTDAVRARGPAYASRPNAVRNGLGHARTAVSALSVSSNADRQPPLPLLQLPISWKERRTNARKRSCTGISVELTALIYLCCTKR